MLLLCLGNNDVYNVLDVWRFPKTRGTILGLPIVNKDYSIWGSILGPHPFYGNSHMLQPGLPLVYRNLEDRIGHWSLDYPCPVVCIEITTRFVALAFRHMV